MFNLTFLTLGVLRGSYARTMTDLVSEIGTELSKKLEYKYPDKLENDIRKYLAGLKPKT